VKNKHLYLVGMLFLCAQFVLSQPNSVSNGRHYNGIAVGLGVSGINTPSIVDYINLNSTPVSKLDDFAAAAEFFGAGTFQISSSWGFKIEYAYLIKTYNIPIPSSLDNNFTIKIHMPTVIAQYIIPGDGYLFKFGAGAGYHIAQFSQDLFYSNTEYQAHGIGVKLEAEGNTAFDDHLYGYIVMDVRGDLIGDFKDSDNNSITNRITGKTVGMNFLSIGLKFGLAYYI
jgi:hypothetical protein